MQYIVAGDVDPGPYIHMFVAGTLGRTRCHQRRVVARESGRGGISNKIAVCCKYVLYTLIDLLGVEMDKDEDEPTA